MLHKIIRRNDYLYIVDHVASSIGDWIYNEHWGHSEISDNETLYGNSYHKSAFKIIAHLPLNNVKQLDDVPLLPSIKKESLQNGFPIWFVTNNENDWTGEYVYEEDNNHLDNRFIVVEMSQLEMELEELLGMDYRTMDYELLKKTIDNVLHPINISQIILDNDFVDRIWESGKKTYKAIIEDYLDPNGYTEINGETYGDEDYICIDYKNKEWCWCENGYYPFCYKDNMEKYQHLPSITLADLVKRRS